MSLYKVKIKTSQVTSSKHLLCEGDVVVLKHRVERFPFNCVVNHFEVYSLDTRCHLGDLNYVTEADIEQLDW
jgi:hypothetical protein